MFGEKGPSHMTKADTLSLVDVAWCHFLIKLEHHRFPEFSVTQSHAQGISILANLLDLALAPVRAFLSNTNDT